MLNFTVAINDHMFSKNHPQRSIGLLIFFLFFGASQLLGQTWYEQGKAATDKNQKVVFFTRSIEQERQDKWVYYFRAWAFNDLGKYERSIRDFETARKADGNLHESYLLTGIAWGHYGLGENNNALRAAKEAIELKEDNAEAWNVLGWSQIGLEMHQEAIASFSRYIQFSEDQYMGLANRSRAYSLSGMYQKALDDCESALALRPDNNNLLERKAYCMMKLGQKQEAIDLIRDKIEFKPEDPISLSQLGDLFFRNQDYTTAIRYHTDAIALYNRKIREDKDFKKIFRDDIYEIYMSRGEAHYAIPDYHRALADYKMATTIAPEKFRAWFEIGQLQTYQSNWFEGAQAFEKAFAIRPDLKFGWVNLGFCYGNLDQPHRAIDAYTRGIANNPGVGLLYNNRGYSYLELQKYDLALADLQMAIEVEPEIVMSHVSLGEFYYDTKNYQEAIDKFDEAIKMEDGSDQAYAAAHYTRGMCYFQLEQFEKAKTDFLKAIEITPGHVLAHEKLGMSHFHLEEFCDSYKILKKTLDLEKTIPFPQKQAKEAPKYLGKMTRNPC